MPITAIVVVTGWDMACSSAASLAGGAGARVAVGTEITLRPPHRSRRALLTHRALASDVDEEPLLRPRVQDARMGQVAFGNSFHPAPCQAPAAPLAATPENPHPALDHVVPEGRDCRTTHRHSVVGEPPAQDLGKPLTLPLDPVVSHRQQASLDF